MEDSLKDELRRKADEWAIARTQEYELYKLQNVWMSYNQVL